MNLNERIMQVLSKDWHGAKVEYMGKLAKRDVRLYFLKRKRKALLFRRYLMDVEDRWFVRVYEPSNEQQDQVLKIEVVS